MLEPNAIQGLSLRIGDGKVWLDFVSNDGRKAALDVEAAGQAAGGPAAAVLRQWCQDRKTDPAWPDAVSTPAP